MKCLFRNPQKNFILVIKPLQNSHGFLAAEFLMSFIVVIGAGIIIFGLSFALTAIEISQYIVWSAARNYAVGHIAESNSKTNATLKYKNLTAAFPLMTGNGSDNPWFEMADSSSIRIGDLAADIQAPSSGNNNDGMGQVRHPWYGVKSTIDLKLFKNLQIPFLGKIAANKDDFVFPVRGILLRHPSVTECQDFFEKKYSQGIQRIIGTNWSTLGDPNQYTPHEDNGC